MKQTTTRISLGGKTTVLCFMLFLLFAGGSAWAQLAYWNPFGQSGYGVSPFAATTTDPNVTVTGLTRGAGLTTTSTAATNAWGANGWADNQATDDYTWTMTANSGYTQSLTSISFCYRRSSTGPNLITFQYSLNGGAYTTITSASCTSTATTGVLIPLISLTGYSDLQNVPAGTVVTFRITGSGSTNAGGTFYLVPGSGSTGLTIAGTTAPAAAPCAAPTGLAAANITHNSADLSWSAQAGAAGYEYAVDQNAAAPASGTATTGTTFNATTLSAAATNYLHVRTDCGSGNFSPWTTISFTTLAAPCAAPTGLTAANITYNSADLSWTAQSGVSGYEYAVDQNAAAPASGTATTGTTFNATTLSAATTNYLHVRTDCGSGNFSPWTTISFTTLVAPCAAPTDLAAANITDNSADLSWSAQAGAAGYEYAVDQNAAAPASGTATTGTTFNATALSAATTNYLHVRTDCGSGNFSPWATISFTTLVAPCAAPTGLTAANITDNSADLSWSAQAGAAGYEYAVDQNAAAPASGTATTGTTFNATTLSAVTTNYLHVRTDCGSGNFSPWTTISFTTLAAPCAAPTSLAAANITDNSADLSWTAQAGGAGYEYVVDEASADPASGTVTTGTTASAPGLSGSTTYYVHVRTDCGGGNFSSWSTISFTTLLTPCAAPSGLTAANVTENSADLSWAAQSGVSGYEYTVDQNAAAPASGTATTGTAFNATTLSTATTYYLHVRTDCGGGNFSPWTTIPFMTLVTPCAAPTGLTAANITDVSADLSWTAQAGVLGYDYAVTQTAATPASPSTTTAAAVAANGLLASTTYYLHVRTDCGNGNFSPWTTLSFTTTATPIPCPEPTGVTVINITTTSASIGWAFQVGATGYAYIVDQSASDPAGMGTATGSNSGAANSLQPGTNYFAHVRSNCGGGNFSDWVTVAFTTASTIGLDELAEAAFTVFPNPVADNLTVQSELNGTVSLVNAEGRQLLTVVLENEATIDVSALEAGVYFVHFNRNGTETVRRIVKY